MGQGNVVTITFKLSTPVLRRLDLARGTQSRSAWVRDTVTEAINTYLDPQAAQMRQQNQDPNTTSNCPHPPGRVIRGYCGACGKPTGQHT